MPAWVAAAFNALSIPPSSSTKPRSLAIAPVHTPVSYTHLCQYGTDVLGRGDDTSGCVQPAPERVQNEFCNGLVQARRTCSPVSYTHLDVYKRQIIQDACATKDLEFQGVKVEAEKVQAIFLAALTPFYATIISTDEYIKSCLTTL